MDEAGLAKGPENGLLTECEGPGGLIGCFFVFFQVVVLLSVHIILCCDVILIGGPLGQIPARVHPGVTQDAKSVP